MGFCYRFHLHTEVDARLPGEVLAWLRDEGPAEAMLAVLPAPVADHLHDLVEWRPPLDVRVEELRHGTRGDPTPRLTGHRITVSGLVHESGALVVHVVPAVLAP